MRSHLFVNAGRNARRAPRLSKVTRQGPGAGMQPGTQSQDMTQNFSQGKLNLQIEALVRF